MTKSHPDTCVAGVANLPAGTAAASLSAPAGAALRRQPTPGCVPGHGVFQSGAGYCIGY